MMFEHSVKVPRHFKVAATILKKVSTEGGSVKTLLYDNKLRHFRTNVLYALLSEAIKHSADLDKMFENSNLLSNEPRLDPWLAKVLATELLFGKKTLPGQSKPEQTILSYKDQFDKFATENQDTTKTEAVRPRYVRINTNLLTTSDAIGAFQDEGYRFIRCTSSSYEDYLKQIQGLNEYDFTQDYHVKTIFVFAPGTKFHDHDLYMENKIILQDKATAMAVHLLAPPAGCVALDMCAAPGMKTTQLAAYMRNTGKIYAVERNETRYQTLCEFVEKTGSTCVQTMNKDCLEIKRGDLDDVEYILLDPSCSGSGMQLSVHNYVDAERLAKLTSLQEKFLKHAMNAFPKAKKIVYSTCSIFPEENERVITNVVKTSRSKWRVQDVKELLKNQWNNFGSGMYGSIGTRCLYSKLDSDFTTGFFLAVLERDAKDLEKSLNKRTGDDNVEGDLTEDIVTKKKKKKENNPVNVAPDLEESNDTINTGVDNQSCNVDRYNTTEDPGADKKKKKKRKHKETTDSTELTSIESQDVNETFEVVNKKKKSKRKNEVDENIDIQEIGESSSADLLQPHKKKHKKHKDHIENDATETCGGENEKFEIPKKKKEKKHGPDE